ncbi:MAG: UDP-glucose/GDP-mannose dehydrogenase family protein [Phycisphaeraceae bacterium]|nr:UDP-glucose/GDP-mannose dehydrogenase family protein [Phycisphaeraceae bacterium]
MSQDATSLNASPKIRLAVIGMGYVGAVSAAALARQGFDVACVEIHPAKLGQLRAGQPPVFEPGLAELFASEQSRLHPTDDLAHAARQAQVILIAVGTPSDRDGRVSMDAMDRVLDQLAEALRGSGERKVVLVRSTVPPGAIRDRIQPRLHDASPSIIVAHHPEFLREGSALKDWKQPPMIVWGADDADQPAVAQTMELLYAGIDAPRVALTSRESELVKYASNIFHAIKIDFANEIGSLAAACGADPAKVMAAFCMDRKLNISPAYLKPGFAFGGSCLPKDTRAVLAAGRERGLALPLVGAVIASNQEHLRRQLDHVLQFGRRPTLLLGLSFKAGTDDLRESPMVELAERLLGKGVPLSIHDPDLAPDKLVGANERYVREHLPHLRLLLRNDLTEALRAAEVVLIAKPIADLSEQLLAGKMVVDLHRGPAVAAGESPILNQHQAA